MIVIINRDKEEELEREKSLRKELEQRFMVRYPIVYIF